MTDPATMTVAVKILNGVATPALRNAVQQVWQMVKDSDRRPLPDPAAIRGCAQWLSEKLDVSALDVSSAQWIPLERYFESPEFTTLLEHMMVTSLAGESPNTDLLERELIAGLDLAGINLGSLSHELFEILADMVEIINSSVGYGSHVLLTDAGQESASRIRLDMYLQAIERHLARLNNCSDLDLDSLDERLRSYRAAAAELVGKIQPPSMDGAATIPIDELYVPASLRVSVRGDSAPVSDESAYISLKDVTNRHRGVVLGDPGGGKSTLCKKLAHNLLISDPTEAMLRGNKIIIPFILVLRDFGRQMRNAPTSIAEYISLAIKSSYQVDISTKEVEWLLSLGRIHLFIDGLDELLDTEDRKAVAQSIDAFAILYPQTRILVTSRRVGYMKAPLSNPAFDIIQLGALTPDGVETYAKNWFALQTGMNSSEREQLAVQFISESQVASDVRQNPLMLALMCTIYRNESFIPRNRPELYEKCSRMLFDRWDRHRGLLEPFEFEAHIEPALMYIAHKIYGDAELESGVTESSLIAAASEYLHTWQYNDLAKAEFAARQFVDFCKGRAWVFTDVGLNENDESLYQFTHRTFMEYFTAAHLARTQDGIDSLTGLLIPRIAASEWDVVAQLALQIKTRSLQGGPDKAVLAILGAASMGKREDRVALLSFVSRSLSFMIVTPSCTREIVRSILDLIEVDGDRFTENWKPLDADDSSGVVRYISMTDLLIEPLASAAREIKVVLPTIFSEELAHRLGVAEEKPLQAHVQLSINLHILLGLANADGQAPDSLTTLHNDAMDILIDKQEKWPWAVVALLGANRIDWADAFEAQGDRLLYMSPFVPGSLARYIPLCTYGLRRRLLREVDLEGNFSTAGLQRMVRVFAERVIQAAPLEMPLSGDLFAAGTFGLGFQDDHGSVEIDIDVVNEDDLYGVAILLAFQQEIYSHEKPFSREVKDWASTSLAPLIPAVSKHLLDVGHATLSQGSNIFREAFADWAASRINFVNMIP